MQDIIDIRSTYSKTSLADLYDPISMPANLNKAHQVLDKCVDAAYRKKKFNYETERVAHLFNMYKEICSASLI